MSSVSLQTFEIPNKLNNFSCTPRQYSDNFQRRYQICAGMSELQRLKYRRH